jgi:predicted TIM-barrel fold metal-dependent hydrolase
MSQRCGANTGGGTSMAHQGTQASTLKSSVKVIDVDTHLSEPEDLWTKRAPAKFKDRVPQIRTIDGKVSWVINGNHPIGLGASASSVFHKDGRTSSGIEFVEWRNADVIPASYDARARVALMDEAGIYAQIVYPNVMGFGGQNTATVDPELRLISAQIYNDAMVELQEESGDRLFPMATLPWWDVGAAVAEAKRAHANGLHGININSDPHKHRDANGKPLPDLSVEYWNPLWETCESLGLPINFHIGASEQSMDWIGTAGWPSLSVNHRSGLAGSMMFLDNGRVIGNLIYSGLLDRFPKLKFVSVESGIGWIPFVMESLDYQFSSLITKSNLLHKPSEYFRKNFYACFWFEKRDISHVIEQVGVDNCMFETDFPHIVCLHPAPLKFVEEGLSKLDDSAREKVMSANAAKVYNINLRA